MPEETTEELYLEFDSNLYRIDNLNIPILTKKSKTSAISTLADLGSGSYSGNMEVDGGYIQSSNFKTGSAGWQLSSDGNFEGNNGTFRGSITATSGTIGGWTIGATTLTGGGVTLSSAGTITGGTIRTASSGSRVQMVDSSNALQVYSGSTKRIELAADEITFYNSSGVERGGIYASTTEIYIHALSGGNIIIDSEGALNGIFFFCDGAETANFGPSSLAMSANIQMNGNNIVMGSGEITGILEIEFDKRTATPNSDGEVFHYDNGTTQNFRTQMNSIDYTFDLSFL